MANKKIDRMTVATGRRRKEDDTVVNIADMIEALYNALVVNKDAGMQLTGSNTVKSGQKNVTIAGTQVALGTLCNII